MARLFPSLMAADLLNLGAVIATLEPYCDGFHIDIMDNHFVPNITFGADMANAIAQKSQKPCWVHLMVDKPNEFIATLSLKRDSIITFHAEGNLGHEDMVTQIHALGCKVGVALKPATQVSTVTHLLPLVDQILVMSVEPGFSGQEYISSVESKVKELAAYRKDHNLSFKIGIDGGIKAHHIPPLKKMGVDDFAVASALFDTVDYKATCRTLRDLTK